MSKLINIGWILAALTMVAVYAYEIWHPCGMRSFRADSSDWVDRCL